MKSPKWERVISEYEASGKSPTEFCRGKGIATSTFHYWLKKSGAKGGEVSLPSRTGGEVGFIRLGAPSSVEVSVGRAVIRCGVEQLRSVLEVLDVSR